MTDGYPGASAPPAPLVSDDRAAAAAARLRQRLTEDGLAAPDAESMALGIELAAHRIERGRPGFHAVALGVSAALRTDPGRLRRHLRGWYEGARGLMEDDGRATDALDSPEGVRDALQDLTGEGGAPARVPAPAAPPAPAPAPAPAPTMADAPRPGGFAEPAAERPTPPKQALSPGAADADAAPDAAPAARTDGLFGALEAAETAVRDGTAVSYGADSPLSAPDDDDFTEEDMAFYSGNGGRRRRRRQRDEPKVGVRRSDMLWGALFVPGVLAGLAVFLLAITTPPINFITGLDRWQVFSGLQASGMAMALWLPALTLVLPPLWYAMNRGWYVILAAPFVFAFATAALTAMAAFIVTRSFSHPSFMPEAENWLRLWGPIVLACTISVSFGPYLRRFNRRTFRKLGKWWDRRFGSGA
ncbi:hypothetical protein ACQ5SO_19515 [Rhodovulum sp. DZ06]|uniref:hypothetical protein n=1 Tax=Rhodovulum sp. DZ06 TaxID=3425126 RepID=UPI003D34AF16